MNADQIRYKISILTSMVDLFKKVLGLQTELEKRKVEEMVRRVCKEEGLSDIRTNVLVATVWAESGMNPKAINKNRNGSIDFGIAQFNDGPPGVSSDKKWWIGSNADFTSPEEVLSDPEKCIRVMCREWKNGNADRWVAYKTAKYIHYLNR